MEKSNFMEVFNGGRGVRSFLGSCSGLGLKPNSLLPFPVTLNTCFHPRKLSVKCCQFLVVFLTTILHRYMLLPTCNAKELEIRVGSNTSWLLLLT